MSVAMHKKKSAKNGGSDSNYKNYLHSLSESQLQQIINAPDVVFVADRNGEGGTKDRQQPNQSLTQQEQLVNLERENRLSTILRLHMKGLNQQQIAQELHIDQSTVSRDLHLVQQESKNRVEKYMREDILLEYLRYIVGSNEITQTLWEMVQSKDATRKEKMNAISLLMQMYDSRLQRMTAGPESFLNIKKSLSEMDLQTMVDSNPVLKAHIQQKKLLPKGLSGVS
jgi:predicted transcriptional regulator